jgi:tryptophan synthase alpha chain
MPVRYSLWVDVERHYRRFPRCFQCSRLKKLTSVPVCVGFGISKAEHAATVAQAGADGVIIGSKLVGLIESNLNNGQKMLSEISGFLAEVKNAIAN